MVSGAWSLNRGSLWMEAARARGYAGPCLYMSPRGKPLTQQKVRQLAQQPDLLLNPDNNRKVEFDAEIVNDDVADILFKVPVWERVIVTNDAFGTPKAEHLAESRPRFNGGEWETVFDPESGGSLA